MEHLLEERAVRVRMPEGSYPGKAKRFRVDGHPGVCIDIKMDVPIPLPDSDSVHGEYSNCPRGRTIADAVALMRAGIMKSRGRGWRPTARDLARVHTAASRS